MLTMLVQWWCFLVSCVVKEVVRRFCCLFGVPDKEGNEVKDF